jgi:hypothetical protein
MPMLRSLATLILSISIESGDCVLVIWPFGDVRGWKHGAAKS